MNNCLSYTAGSSIIRRGRRRIRTFGFTLLEVMVALLVVAIGMGAVSHSTGSSSWQTSFLKQKTFASWVAQNQIVLLRAKKTWGNPGNKQGVEEMANATWLWKMKISETDDPLLRKIDVDVYLDGDTAILATMTGFIAKP